MKKYLADILTFSRFILFLAMVLVAIFLPGTEATEIVLVIFIVAELTDAFDGVCATKWPFPKDHIPKYRKYAAKADMLADCLVAVTFTFFFALKVNTIIGLSIVLFYGILYFITEPLVYGHIFLGHPDDFRKNSLIERNFPLAKKIILTRRAIYLTLLGLMGFWTLYMASWSLTLKIILTIISVFAIVFFWFFLSQRRHNISRDAVKIEKKLSK
ncbi:MAG: hypothetical protein Q4A79_00985 [Candidatus Saccharibacteria bacterium]|nr:hypothetical protein [Candidatus Saccharibacteria bacterium]